MASPDPASGTEDQNQTGCIDLHNNDQGNSDASEPAATVPIPVNAVDSKNTLESPQPKSEEPSTRISDIAQEGVTNNPVSQVDEPVVSESSNNNLPQSTDLAATADIDIVPEPQGDTIAAAVDTVPVEPRTIVLKRKLFKSPNERALEAARIERRLEEAGDKFRQSLISRTPSLACANATKPTISCIAGIDDQLIEVGGRSEPISIDSDGEVKKPSAHLRTLKRSFKQKQVSNHATQDNEENRRLVQAENFRHRGKHGTQESHSNEEIKEEGHEDDLSFEEDPDVQAIDTVIMIDDTETVEAGEAPPKKRRKPNRANKVPHKSVAENVEAGWELSKIKRGKEDSRKPRKPKTPASKKANARVSKKKTKGSERNGPKDGAKGKGHTMLNIESLFDNDIISAAQANQSKGDLPSFKSKKKDEAFKELIASMPKDQQKLANVDKRALEKATKVFNGHGSMKADGDSNWKLKGMRCSLKAFQVLGVAFMRERENSASRPHGGLDADVMGLGKTIKMIANIIDGKPADSGANNTTLVVCPAGLCIQWLKEIQRHVESGALGQVMIYRSTTQNQYSDLVAALTSCNVVITTYGEVNKSYPQIDQPKQLVTEQHQREWWEKNYEEKRGALHRVNFRRVVLDEAQTIKNHTSKVSLACRSLHGKYRWALTGTPIQNKVEEFFPYFSFLKVENTGSYATFKSNFCKRGSKVALERLHAILNKIMIRRTHEDELFGRPLVGLPNVTRKTVTVEFNPIEKAIYKIVRNRFIAQIRMYARARPLNQSYRGILVLYLRLRQLVGHILLIQKTITELLESEDLEKLWRLTDSEVHRNSGNRGVLQQLKTMLSNKKPTPSDQNKEKTPQVVDPTTEASQSKLFNI